MIRIRHRILCLALLCYILPAPSQGGRLGRLLMEKQEVDACTGAKAGISGGCVAVSTVSAAVGGVLCAFTLGIGCIFAVAGAAAGAACAGMTSELLQCDDGIDGLRAKLDTLDEETDKIMNYVGDIKQTVTKLSGQVTVGFFEEKYVSSIQNIVNVHDLYQMEIVKKATKNGLITANIYTKDWVKATLFGRYDIRGDLNTIEDMIEGRDYLSANPSVYELAHRQGFCTPEFYQYITGILIDATTLFFIATEMNGNPVADAETKQFSDRLKLSEHMYTRYCCCSGATCSQTGVSAAGSAAGYDVILLAGTSITSPNGEAALKMQEDGNLVVICPKYGNSKDSVWESKTAGKAIAEGLVLQVGGNMALKDATGKSIWQSSTSGIKEGVELTVTNNHNAVLKIKSGQLFWLTNTEWKCPVTRKMTSWSNSNMNGIAQKKTCDNGRYIRATIFREQNGYGLINMKIMCSDNRPFVTGSNLNGHYNKQHYCTNGVAEIVGRYQNWYGMINAKVRCYGSSQFIESNSNSRGSDNDALKCESGLKPVGIEVRYQNGYGLVNWRLECARVE